MNYKKQIESYYQDRLNNNILVDVDDNELPRLIRESPEIFGVLISNKELQPAIIDTVNNN